MISERGYLAESIKSSCKNYSPIKDKSTIVMCEQIGRLYECANYEGKLKGCIFCKNKAMEKR